MPIRRTTWLLVLALLAIGCEAPEQDGPMDDEPMTLDEAEIDAVRTQFTDAFAQQDAQALSMLFTEEARVINPMGEVAEGRSGVQEAYQQNFDMGLNTSTVTPTETILVGDVVWETGSFTNTGESPEGEPIELTGKYVVLLQPQDGTWKIHRLVGYMPAPPPDAMGEGEMNGGELG